MTESRLKDEEREDMSQETENKQCQICKGYLFEDDDVVICPECGAPHHRDCWQTVGHCGVAENHGTDLQYDKVKAKEQEKSEADGDAQERVCPSCGKSAKATEGNFCPHCGKPYFGQTNDEGNADPFAGGPNVFRGGIPYAPNTFGGIPKDSKIEDVKVEHIARFVGSNPHRYVPKFATLNKQNKGSWNWAAFLFPSVWCMARKMYSQGILLFVLTLASGLSMIPFSEFVLQFFEEGMTQTQLYTEAFNNIGKLGLVPAILLGVSLVLNFVPRIILGLRADWMYRGFALDKVRKITADPEVEDLNMTLLRSGSINMFAMLLTFIAQQYLPGIIGSFIW